MGEGREDKVTLVMEARYKNKANQNQNQNQSEPEENDVPTNAVTTPSTYRQKSIVPGNAKTVVRLMRVTKSRDLSHAVTSMCFG